MSVHVCSKYQRRAEAQMSARGRKLLFYIVDLSPVTDIDASAVHFLQVAPQQLMQIIPNIITTSRMHGKLLQYSVVPFR